MYKHIYNEKCNDHYILFMSGRIKQMRKICNTKFLIYFPYSVTNTVAIQNNLFVTSAVVLYVITLRKILYYKLMHFMGLATFRTS